uniref:Uncharacterized protein n=1 Tax=Xiphophorus couchianus TaxID=32473 RepID=A0A3B5LS94_9TELE
MLQGVFSSWICLLLFSFGACAPIQKSKYPRYLHLLNNAEHDTHSFSNLSLFCGWVKLVLVTTPEVLSAAQDARITRMIADKLCLNPYGSRPALSLERSPGSSGNGCDHYYQRARDFRSDSKYTQDTFDHILVPKTPQNPGRGS